MPVGSHTFWLPRRGNSPDEYEDAFAVEDASGRYAVADGATEGCFTGLWARLLGRGLRLACGGGCQPVAVLAARRPGAMGRRRSLPEAGLGRRPLGRTGRVCRLPGSRADGPRPRATCQWQAVAVGDTCLFHTRDGVLLARVSRWTAPTSSATGRSLSARVCPSARSASDSASGTTAVGSRATGSGP